MSRPAADRVDWQLVPWSAAALCAGLALASLWHSAKAPVPDAPPVSRLEVRAAAGTSFDTEPDPIAIAPDGRTLAWSACERTSGRCALYVRPLDRLDAQPLAGTDGAHAPAFSRDGRWIAFFADGALKKIATAGGAATTIAPAPDPGGAAWASDGRIFFAPSAASGLAYVDADGGSATPITRPAAERGELRHRNPASIAAVRRGDALAFTIASDPDNAAPGALAFLGPDAPGVRAVRSGVHRAVPAGDTYLIIATTTDLQAATFDERTLTLTGPTDSVPAPSGGAVAHFAVGGNTLALVRSPSTAQRLWNDGADASLLSRFTSIAISPDGRRAAGVVADRGTSDIWIADLALGANTRLTFSGTNVSPAWSAAGDRVLYATRDDASAFRVVSRAATDRVEDVTPMSGIPSQSFPTSAVADRVALTRYKDGHTAVILTSAHGDAPRVLSEGPFDEGAAALSPDGRWVALESSASGRIEIIVRAAEDGRRVAVVSSDGGRAPHWSADGRAVYFTSGRRLLRAAFAGDREASASRADIVADRDGDRVLAVAPSGRYLLSRQPSPDTAVVVLQWLRELRERLPLPVNTPR